MARSWLAALREGLAQGHQGRTRRRRGQTGGVQDLLSRDVSQLVESLEARTLMSVTNTSGTINVNEATGNNTILVRLDATGQNVDIYENTPSTGTPTYETALSGVTQILVQGNSGDDQLIVDFSNGSPIPTTLGIGFIGLAGTNTVVLQGGSVAGTETVGNLSATQGGISIGTGEIAYADVASVSDTVSVSNVVWTATLAVNHIVFGDGTAIGGTQTTAITNSGSPTFVAYSFANKTAISLSSFDGGDTFDINNPNAGVGLTNATFIGSNDTDTFNVTPSSTVLYNIDAAGGLSSTTGSDVLNLNLTGVTNSRTTSVNLSGTYSGSIAFDNRQSVAYEKIATLTPLANLQVSLIGPATAVQGATVTYGVTVGSTGPDAANNLTIYDAIPVGMTFVSANFTRGTGGLVNGVLVWNMGTFVPNSAVSGSITLRATGTGSIDNTVSVRSESIQAGTVSQTATTLVSAAPPAPVITQGLALSANTNVPTDSQTLATFTDTGVTSASTFTASIAWGDGSSASPATVTLANGVFAITGPAHTYTTAGSFVRTITLLQSGISVATITDTVVVTDPPILGTANSLSIVQFGGLNNAVVATFVQGNASLPANSFYALIRWGDGAITAGTVTKTDSTYTVKGSHTYNSPGAFNVLVTVSEGAITGRISSSVNVIPGGTANQHFVAAVYQTLLHREVDPFALAGWSGLIDSGTSRTTVVQYIENSAEYQSIVIQSIYQTYLGRTLDSGALAGPLAFMQSGGTAEQLASYLIGSQEYFINRGGNTNAGFVTALYRDVLHRAPDSGGLTAWTSALAGGLTPLQLATGFLASAEYQSVLIRSYYSTYLGHAPNQTALDFWVGVLRQSGRDDQVIASILGSNEYFQRVT